MRRYIPLLPMVLVNGAEGIGTGWSTSIPNYNPRDIVANLRRLLAGEPLGPMHPWYKGFKGAIVNVPGKATYDSFGIITQAWPRCLAMSQLNNAVQTLGCMNSSRPMWDKDDMIAKLNFLSAGQGRPEAFQLSPLSHVNCSVVLPAQLDDNTLDVTELPVKKWTQDYKEHLESLLKADEKVLPVVTLPNLTP